MSDYPLDRDFTRKLRILRAYPKLKLDSFIITSYDCLSEPESKIYNCVAWALGKTDNWWWPNPNGEDSVWPEGVPKKLSLEAFIQAAMTERFIVCTKKDHSYEVGIEKIAIYVNPGTEIPSHLSRQKENGRWTSKLGPEEDIEHDYEDLAGNNGDEYGEIVVILRRTREPVETDPV